MRPVVRVPVNKNSSARQFRGKVGKTKAANMRMPVRGGWRM